MSTWLVSNILTINKSLIDINRQLIWDEKYNL